MSRPNTSSARPAPTEFTDVKAPQDFLVFTPFPYTMFSKDGCKRVVFPTQGFLKVSEATDVEHPPMVIEGAEFTVGKRAPGSAPATLQGSEELLKTLEDNPTRDIIVLDRVAPYIPASHLGAVFTVPVRPRIYEDAEGKVVGADGIDLYREAAKVHMNCSGPFPAAGSLADMDVDAL